MRGNQAQLYRTLSVNSPAECFGLGMRSKEGQLRLVILGGLASRLGQSQLCLSLPRGDQPRPSFRMSSTDGLLVSLLMQGGGRVIHREIVTAILLPYGAVNAGNDVARERKSPMNIAPE